MAKTKKETKPKSFNEKVLEQWETQYKTEILAVKELGEKIGYGNMMSIASTLWAMDLRNKHGITSGAFIPTTRFSMKKPDAKKALDEQERQLNWFEKILK